MPDSRVLVGTGSNLEVEVYADGVLTDSTSTVTVTITRADGTILASGAATTHPSTGIYRYVLLPQTELDQLTLVWAVTIGGIAQTLTTYAEIVGDELFTIAQARAFKVAGTAVLASTTTYPQDTILEVRDEVTDDFEQRAGVSFIPRYRRQTISGSGSDVLILDRPRIQRVISVTVDSVAYTATELADLDFDDAGILTRKTLGWFSWGSRNVTVEYVHGYAQVLATIRRAGLLRTLMILNPAVAGSTVNTWTSPEGTTYSYDQAGQQISGTGYIRHYGVPAIDVALAQYGMTGIAVA